MTATTTKPAKPTMSRVYSDGHGNLVGPLEVEVPVGPDFCLAGQLHICPTPECGHREWVMFPIPAEYDLPCCPRHPTRLTPALPDGTPADRVGKVRDRARAAVATRRDAARAAVAAKADAAKARAANAVGAVLYDLRGTRLSAGAAVAVAATVAALRDDQGPWATAAAGAATATVGAAAAYVVAQRVALRKARDRADDGAVVGRASKRVQMRARQCALAAVAAGVWTVMAAAGGTRPDTFLGAVVWAAFAALTVLVCWQWWVECWTTARRIRRLAAERYDTTVDIPDEEEPVEDDDDPLVVGRRFAATWRELANSPSVPSGFRIGQTGIVVEETRRATMPAEDGTPVVIGWEYSGVAEPGALVGRPGAVPPIVANTPWIASMLALDPSHVSITDRPTDEEGNAKPNTFSVVITSATSIIGTAVKWQGPDGVRRHADGSLYAHIGRTLMGEAIHDLLYRPTAAFGGLTIGTTGGGKSAGTNLRLLNSLAAGIFPILHDPKQLVDYAEWLGVIPIGVTQEHAYILLDAMRRERMRRETVISSRRVLDRHGRARPGAAAWDTADGPPILGVFEEFHITAADEDWSARATTQVRLQRVAGIGLLAVTQGGGLADLRNSNLRALLANTDMTIYRVADGMARLAGYTGLLMPSQLPRIPGVCLRVAEGAPVQPMRAAYVTKEDEEGSLFDWLYNPDGTPRLQAPDLPAETVATFEAAGLMDLWRLGQGPNGGANLLGDTANYAPTAANVVVPPGAKQQAADVICGIVAAQPDCLRAAIDNSPVWTTSPGWGKPPALSTVSRAVAALVRAGDLTVADGRHRLTAQGQARIGTPTTDEAVGSGTARN